MCDGHRHDPLRDTIANLRRPMPLGRKLRLVAKNTWLRVRRLSTCCGNYGEPGC